MSTTKEKKKQNKSPRLRKPSKERQVESVAIIPNRSLVLDIENPSQVMGFGKILQKYIGDNNLSVVISNKPYAMVGGWQFAGNAFGITAVPRKPTKVHEKGQYITTLFIMKEFRKKDGGTYTKEVPIFVGFSDDMDAIKQVKTANKISKEITTPYFAYNCECDLKRKSDGVIVGYGEGFCSNLEILKSGMDEYSVHSMSQTRSIGKAYRNLIGFIMNSAGYEPTPAEEMQPMEEREKAVKKESEPPKLPKPTSGQFQGLCKRMMDANEKLTVDEIKKHFTLNEEEENSLRLLESKRK